MAAVAGRCWRGSCAPRLAPLTTPPSYRLSSNLAAPAMKQNMRYVDVANRSKELFSLCDNDGGGGDFTSETGWIGTQCTVPWVTGRGGTTIKGTERGVNKAVGLWNSSIVLCIK